MSELNSTGLTPRAWTSGDEVLVINEGGGSPDTIARVNASIPLSMLADLATSTILGRVTSGTGAIEVLTATQVRTLLNVADGAQVNVPTDLAYTAATRSLTSSTGTDVTLPLVTSSDAGLAPASGGGTTNYLRADGTWASPPGSISTIVGITGTKAQFDTAVTDGDFLYVGDVTQYTDELAQDAVGAMVDGSLIYVDATPLLSRSALIGAITASQGSNTTSLGSFTKAQLDTAVSDGNIVFVGDQIDIPVDTTPNTPAASNFGFYGDTRYGGVRPAFVTPDGVQANLQSAFHHKRVNAHYGHGNSTTVSSFGISITATGTATTANIASTNIATAIRRIEYAVTTPATSAVAGINSGNNAQYFLGTSGRLYGGFLYHSRFGRGRGSAANATIRAFNGFSSLTTAPTDVDPSTNLTNAIGVGCDAADTNWFIIHRAGSAAATKVDTGIAKTQVDNNEMFDLFLYSPANTTTRIDYVFKRLSDGATFSGSISTNMPTDTTALMWRGHYSVGGTSAAIGYMHAQIVIETDY